MFTQISLQYTSIHSVAQGEYFKPYYNKIESARYQQHMIFQVAVVGRHVPAFLSVITHAKKFDNSCSICLLGLKCTLMDLMDSL